MALKTTIKAKTERASRVYKTSDGDSIINKGYRWWEAKSSDERKKQLLATVAFLRQGQKFRSEEYKFFSNLYTGKPSLGYAGPAFSKVSNPLNISPGRPTYNLVSSVTDTLVSKLTQDRPVPVFLTDNGDYKERNLAKKLNDFILGEFYRTKSYELGEQILTDALVQGTGIVKVYEGMDNKTAIERVLITELFVDLDEARFGNPRRMYQVKYMDRAMVESAFPKHKKMAEQAETGVIESKDASRSVSDMVILVEGWSLPSGEGAGDGYHSICCSEGELFGEKWEKQKFPFVFLHHKKRPEGFWSQGVAESLMGTQLTLNDLLITIAQSIRATGVPRVFVEEGSKVNKASFQNKVGIIVPYRGTAPIFSVSQSNAPELYEERARLIQFGFEQEGLSMLSATSQKPAGLNSGEAQRVYQDINSDRFASLERRYTNFYVDLAYALIDRAVDIAERDGTYSTVFTDKKRGTKEIELPSIQLLKDPFVIQAYVQSSLPKDPAGRLQKVTEMIQSNMITIQEGRRLLDFPDLGQVETLANASEERIYFILDEIIENGVYEGPDQFMNLQKATEIVTQYINLYTTCKLEEEKVQMLRDFFSEIQDLQMAAMPPQAMLPPGAGIENQLAVPQPLPQSPMLPQGGGGGIPMFAEGGLVEDQKKNSEIDESGLPSWLQKTREVTVPAFQAASQAVQDIPGLDTIAKITELTSPAVYAFRQAGTPTPEGGLLEQISHVPGAQVAADLPVGWKVIKGQGMDLHELTVKLQKNELRMEHIMKDVPNSVTSVEELKQYLSDKQIQKWNKLDKENYELQKEIQKLNQSRRSRPELEVTRTPEELAQIKKQHTVVAIKDVLDHEDWYAESFAGKPLDQIAKELRKTFDPEFVKNVTDEEIENLLIQDAKGREAGAQRIRESDAKRAAQKAAEEERLKNVVVPIEIEGGPLKKPNPKNRYEIVKEGDNYWIIDKLHNEKTVALKTKKEAQEQIKDFVEDDLKKTGPRKIVPKKED